MDLTNGSMSGNEYRDLIFQYLTTAYAADGLRVQPEFKFGTKPGGTARKIDLLIYREYDSRVLACECKFQSRTGTADQKLEHALRDLAALSTFMPACLAYGGDGWSDGAHHTLQSDPLAVFCMPKRASFGRLRLKRDPTTRQLDDLIIAKFGLWKKILPQSIRLEG